MGLDEFKSGDTENEESVNDSRETVSDDYDSEPENNSRSSIDWYSEDMPHAPAATDGPNEDTIWFEVIEDRDVAYNVASAMNWQPADLMDVVVLIIRDDFREFYIPLNSNGGGYSKLLENLKDEHLSSAAKYNDDIDYDKDVKSISVGTQVDTNDQSSDEVDWDDVMSAAKSDSSVGEDSIEQDLEEAFG